MALLLYQLAATFGFIIALPYVLVRAARHPREMGERLGLLGPLVNDQDGGGTRRRPLWLHAASLGEMEAVAALLEESGPRLRPPIVLTVTSVSARVRARERLPSDVVVTFAPLDLWLPLHLFLVRVRPRGLLLIETELWPLTLTMCRRRGVPVALASGRISANNWRRINRLRGSFRRWLEGIHPVLVQAEVDAERFRALGAREVVVTGNLKYRLPSRTSRDDGEPNRGRDSGGQGLFLWVAGSVRRGEEGLLDLDLRSLDPRDPPARDLPPRDPNLGDPGRLEIRSPRILSVLAPRHLRELAHWRRTCHRKGLAVAQRSELSWELPPLAELRVPDVRARVRASLESLSPDVRWILIDHHGELSAWYSLADAAFVGGSLVPIGGHNLFEPAREGVPVAFGPYTAGVQDLAEPLLRSGGGVQVEGARELTDWLTRLVVNPEEKERRGKAARLTAEHLARSGERTWASLARHPWVTGEAEP